MPRRSSCITSHSIKKASGFPRRPLFSAMFLVVSLCLFALPSGAYTPNVQARLAGLGTVPQPPLSDDAITKIGARAAAIAHPFRATAKTAFYSGNGSLPEATGANGTPVFLSRNTLASLSERAGKPSASLSNTDRALQIIAGNPGVFHIDCPEAELTVEEEIPGVDGRLHVRFSQSFNGVPVWGSGLTVHFDADGGAYSFSGRYIPTPSGVDVANIRCSRERASKQSLASRPAETDAGDGSASARLVIWTDHEQRETHLAWQVTMGESGTIVRQCFVDAVSGATLEEYDETPSATPTTAAATDYLGKDCTLHVTEESDRYTMNDTAAFIQILDANGKNLSAGESPVLAFSKNNTWTDLLLVSAYNNARKTYEYYLNTFGRPSLLGGKSVLYLVLHYTSGGQPVKNAFWAGGYAAFGDVVPYASALDIVAHEITHGVVEKTIGLVYNYQSGALNEGFADFFGAMVDPDWEIGEDLPGGPIRNISDPELYDCPRYHGRLPECSAPHGQRRRTSQHEHPFAGGIPHRRCHRARENRPYLVFHPRQQVSFSPCAVHRYAAGGAPGRHGRIRRKLDRGARGGDRL